MANIKDVANLAGVSITTVSHVINETRFVSEELQKRVTDAMRELDYLPNNLARSLRSGRTKTIGLIVPDISNLFFAEVARKVEDRGLEYGYSVIFCNSDDDDKKEYGYIDVLIAKQVDGIIFISAGFEGENLQKPLSYKIPIVVADRAIKDIPTDVVLVDNYEGGYTAAKYLIDLGHKRIACISGPSRMTPSAQRVKGYHAALREAGLDESVSLEIAGDFRYTGGEIAMNKLLGLANPPTAVFACNDMMALGAMRAVYDQGLAVPDDISLVGFDDIPLAESVYPALTTIAQPIKEMAENVVDYLVDRIKNKNDWRNKETPEFHRTVLAGQLVERDSCASPRKRDE